MNKQMNGDLEITHDITMSKCPAFEIGEAEVAIRESSAIRSTN